MQSDGIYSLCTIIDKVLFLGVCGVLRIGDFRRVNNVLMVIL